MKKIKLLVSEHYSLTMTNESLSFELDRLKKLESKK